MGNSVKNNRYINFVAISLVLVGIYLLFSILFVFVETDLPGLNRIIDIISAPGKFLFSTFLWASFFVPFYIFVLAYILTLKDFNYRYPIILIASLLPFVTLALFLKVIFAGSLYSWYMYNSVVSDFLVRHMGKTASLFILGIILMIEFILMYKLYYDLAISDEYQDEDGSSSETPTGKGGKKELFRSEWLSLENDMGRVYVDEEGEDIGEVEQSASFPARQEIKKEAKKIAGEQDSEYIEDALVLEKKEEWSSEEDWFLEEEHPSGDLLDNDKTTNNDRATGDKNREYVVPVNNILMDYRDGKYWEIDEETKRAADTLMQTLEEFKIKAELTGIKKGPVITMFEILPAPGVKISKIVNLSDNIALRLAALRVRIVAPIPGKHAVGIEIPNRKRSIVSFKELITSSEFQDSSHTIPIVLGKDITGEAQIIDLVQTPHLLIAGATGSGKSVCVNSIINSILYKKSPDEVRLMLIDPKIVELKFYNDIPHLLTPVITDPKRAFQALQYCIEEMENRYALLDALGVRDINSYNRKVSKEQLTVKPLPYIVIVVDEFADLMATSGREMEATLARLAAMSRAVGIHLVLATQRPSIDVITGLIKANIPSRIAFMVASKFDSRIIIDSVGAEKLLGKGDMLFSAAWDPVPVRIQGAFLSEEEVEAITDHLRSLGEPDYIDDEIFFDEDEENGYSSVTEDPLMEKALEIVFAAGKASASFLQRRLKIGYNRAARLIEEMERRGIVGPQNGSKPREIIKAP